MMKLKNIISDSIAAFVLTIEESKNVDKTLGYLRANMHWLENFTHILFSANGDRKYCDFLIDRFKQEDFRPVPILVFAETNLGLAFGAMDLDRQIYEYCKGDPNVEYVWKFSMDVLANETILDIDIDETCDFFYVNNIGYAIFDKYTLEEAHAAILDQTYFYPQTNHYIYRNNLPKWLPEHKDILNMKERYDLAKQENPACYPWDVLQGQDAGLSEGEGCACEAYLAKTILSQDIKKQQLLSPEDLTKLLNIVHKHHVHDGSHKNFVFKNLGGLCHYHIMNTLVVEI
jgi:hypothetical protein